MKNECKVLPRDGGGFSDLTSSVLVHLLTRSHQQDGNSLETTSCKGLIIFQSRKERWGRHVGSLRYYHRELSGSQS